MPSTSSSDQRRVPQQQRSAQRLRELLEAAGEVIAEVGYEASTMTAIAERAGASIGCVYQYFPNKEALVRSLRALYGEELEQRWAPVDAAADGEQLAHGLIDVMMHYTQERPAYVPLLSAPDRFRRAAEARQRLRERFAGWFRRHQPALTAEEALQMARVTLQTIKGLTQLYGETAESDREALVAEYKFALGAHLTRRLNGRER